MHQSTHFEPLIVKIRSGVQAVDDGKNKKGKKRDRYYKNTQKRYTSCPRSVVPENAIITKLNTAVDLINVITSAKFGDIRF